MTSPTLTMNDGRVIPQLGFGVFQIDPGQTAQAVDTALAGGYRLIDTAQGYANEAGVGEAVRRSDLAGPGENSRGRPARSIGVSNFTREHLSRLARETETVPAVNQVEFHPRFPQQELREYHQEHGIATEAWSPIGQGKGLLDDDVITRLAAEKKRTPAQVVLRWHIQ